jgi:predicted nucleic acid-binding protein
MLFIYWLEDHPEHAGRVHHIQKKMGERKDTLCTSVFTVGEVLTGVYKNGTPELVSGIREFFRPPQVELLPFTAATADQYAQIRSGQRVSPADAIHLATAAEAGVDLFLTNDHSLSGLVIQGIQFIAGMDVSLF